MTGPDRSVQPRHEVSAPLAQDAAHAGSAAGRERITRITADNFQFIWRCLRRLGLSPPDVDDAVQEVFEVATRRLEVIEPGRERAFLFRTAFLIAKKTRRVARRERDQGGGDLDAIPSAGENPEALSLSLERRRLLDLALDELTPGLRAVFVLFELEGLTAREIAELLEIPLGTVASRLRRAREGFRAHAARLRELTERDPP
jgi:RNA polymerase sigma-70 factor, ECF subfamily